MAAEQAKRRTWRLRRALAKVLAETVVAALYTEGDEKLSLEALGRDLTCVLEQLAAQEGA